MKTLTCLRCGKLAQAEVIGRRWGDPSEWDMECEDIEVADDGGMLAYICHDCMTAPEVLGELRRSLVASLNALDAYIQDVEETFRTIPAARDNPQLKEGHAAALKQRAEAQGWLEAALGVDGGEGA